MIIKANISSISASIDLNDIKVSEKASEIKTVCFYKDYIITAKVRSVIGIYDSKSLQETSDWLESKG
jgi:hypothetical protein